MMEKSVQATEGGGCTPTPCHSIYHHVHSCSVLSSWENRYTPPISSLPLYELCGYVPLLWQFKLQRLQSDNGTRRDGPAQFMYILYSIHLHAPPHPSGAGQNWLLSYSTYSMMRAFGKNKIIYFCEENWKHLLFDSCVKTLYKKVSYFPVRHPGCRDGKITNLFLQCRVNYNSTNIFKVHSKENINTSSTVHRLLILCN